MFIQCFVKTVYYYHSYLHQTVTQCCINCFVMSEINLGIIGVYWLSFLVVVTLLYGTDILKVSNSPICSVWGLVLALYKITVL